ncbi:MAG: AraC family transcriptional regulator [Alistipes sp.]|nr:AraC family transcriptional regulator [Alistipes sp.]
MDMQNSVVNASERRVGRISIARIKRELHDVSYLSDDLVFTAINASINPTERSPKTIEGFGALIMLAGEATISVNMKSYTVKPNTLVFFNPGSVIRSERVSANAAGYFLTYSKSFINDIQVGLSSSLPIYMQFRLSPLLNVSQEEISEILQVFRLMKQQLRGDKQLYRNEIVRSLFATAFYIIAEINNKQKEQQVKKGRSSVIFDDFMRLLEQHCRHERNVGFYAEQLDLTPKYFSTAIRDVSGKTAARWIDEAVILEAKTLLKYSDKSIYEIARELNFSTQSFFGKYFKQHTGESPSRYKRK